MKIIWHDLALEELISIGEKVSGMFGEKVADWVVENMMDRVGALASNPFLGTTDEKYLPFRVLHSWHNRIFFLLRIQKLRLLPFGTIGRMRRNCHHCCPKGFDIFYLK